MKAAEVVREFFKRERFDVAVVGGSGIGFAGKELPYSKIPGMPLPKVPGHRGVLKFKEVGGKAVLFFEGRFHYYEGREDWELRFIPKLASELGVGLFIPTCSSGAVSRKAARAEIGVIVEHINLTGRNPLVGLIEKYGEKVFVNGKAIYSWDVGESFLKRGIELGIGVVPVTLAAVLGPNYETFAEVRMLEVLGADCVSMSTVPEAIAAAFYGMEVCGLTVFTNDAMAPEASHDEVLKVAGQRSKKLGKLIEESLLEL